MNFTRFREAAGLSQRELAGKLGIDQSSVACWEIGRSVPRVSLLVKLADLYGCSIDELLGREPKSSA